ncbi:MAG TPA: YiiD C-terminal domain-containing protein [Ktedonobacterales bacterium]|jgi:acyl-coenzyme A thioesterase PaaI-like protein|nr:YiiD C-terminal domain-containing protein [Ktedonobacterales bacterium]
MADLETVSAIMTQAVPFNRVLGLQFVAVEPERAEVVMPEAPERLNHVGTIHAAAQFGLGEAASGAMVMAAFADLQGEGYIPLAASAQIAYRKPSKGDLRGVATLTTDEQARVRAEVEANGKARFSIPVQLLDAQGVVTTEITVEWALIKPRAS